VYLPGTCRVHAVFLLHAISFESLTIRPKLTGKFTKSLFRMESGLCRYTFYADSRVGSLERTRQTAVGAILVDSHASVAM